jgi:hypothetical protein
MTVTVKVTYNAPATVQWQKFVGGTWTNISGATGDSYTYSSFETDVTPTSVSFTLNSNTHVGKLYTVLLRAVTTRTVNGGCHAESNQVTVTKVIAVDP